jgi:hypothetical protein
VIADLKHFSPDLIVHGGDLVASGFRPVEVMERIRELGWPGVSYDGDPRAWYAVLEKGTVTIRRVEYEIDQEVIGLRQSRYPYADWLGRILQTGRYESPPANESFGTCAEHA